jgi:hypothetical protein
MEYVRAGLKVGGAGADHVCLRGNSDKDGMHRLQKIASLIEFMRNSNFLFGALPSIKPPWQVEIEIGGRYL